MTSPTVCLLPIDVRAGDEGVHAAPTEVSGVADSHFKARRLKENSSVSKEVKEQSGDRLSSIRALVRAERRGKRAIVAEMKRMAALFATKFESFKDAQELALEFHRGLGGHGGSGTVLVMKVPESAGGEVDQPASFVQGLHVWVLRL
ncbi:hypothetical protein Bca52824_058317 [Brassica carinata]|uniref:Uncharacterized protein n=1 Tax=Brassica carinata TaxID=52824 RepID=A0A8X7UEG3_BRACI|nr:hypothetical protein Bca52824_058317 [Brassica carinata]